MTNGQLGRKSHGKTDTNVTPVGQSWFSKAGYQMFLIGIIGHFAFQAFLVMISVACFTKNRFE